MYFIEVILPLSLPKTFTYEVNAAEFEFLQAGMRVAVPFGKTKLYTALVVEKHLNQPELYEAKEIDQILDDTPVVTPYQIKHWFWIAEYYMCSIGDVYRSAMPSVLLLESESVICANTDTEVTTSELNDQEYVIFEALQKQSALKIDEVVAILNKKTVLPVIQSLIDKRVIVIREEVKESYKPKVIRYVRLAQEYSQPEGLQVLLEKLKNAHKQRELILGYFKLQSFKKPISVKQLTDEVQSNSASINSLIDKGIFEEYYLEVDRIQFNGNSNQGTITLSSAQEKAFQEIKESFVNQDITLLFGVTSSGKTEVYFKLIEEQLSSGKQVLFLLPEIGLTTQLLSRLRAHFGDKVAVFHSKYSQNERVEVWRQVLEKNPKAQIVIGARSALFLPYADLGLVIVDEEHEATFKQFDPAPRYHARDAAIVLAKMFQAKVLLGSATPSIESYYNATNGKYTLVNLKERYQGMQLPVIKTVDLKDKYFRKQMTGHFSDVLLKQITEALEAGEQIILFQNRRGYSPLLECLTCGHIPQCPQCDVSLTYHKYKSQLRCHYCGYTMAKPTHCHSCRSVDLTTKGFGTEQIEIELKELFPDKSIARMDKDSTTGKFSFEKIIDDFKNRKTDILVGTQMLAKGLDFDNVGLVGIMNADTMLYHPDFRAFERSYQMMTQVAGRAGRSEKQGSVIIQTYNPNHSIIKQVVSSNYEAMYQQELEERKTFSYVPFYRLIRITLKHRDYEKLKDASFWLYGRLSAMQIPVLGPEEPAISRIRNEYIRNIMVKIPQDKSLKAVKDYIAKSIQSFEAIAPYRAVKVTINVDF